MSKLRSDRLAMKRARYHRRGMQLAKCDQMTNGVYRGYCWLMSRKIHAPNDPERHDRQFMFVDAWFYPVNYNS